MSYLALYQFFIIASPILLTPYLARVLGPTKIGIDDYLSSIVQLFSLVVILEIPTYARNLLATSDEQLEQSICSEIFSLQLILTASISGIFLVACCLFTQYQSYLYLYIFTVISVGIDSSWYFIVKEKVSVILTRNGLVRLMTMLIIFFVVKKQQDLNKYILINGGSLLLGQLLSGRLVLKEMAGFKFTLKNAKKHLHPSLLLFVVPCLTMSVSSITLILLKHFEGVRNVAMYNQGFKLYSIIIKIITPVFPILLPTMAMFYRNRDFQKRKKLFMKYTKWLLIGTIPIVVGVVLVSGNIVPILLGESFQGVSDILRWMSIAIFFKIGIEFFSIHYLVLEKKYKAYTVASCFGAVLNILLSWFLLWLNQGVYSLIFGLIIGNFATLLLEFVFSIKIVNKLFFFGMLSQYTLYSGVAYFAVEFFVRNYFSFFSSISLLFFKGFLFLFIYIGFTASTDLQIRKKIGSFYHEYRVKK